MLDRRSFLAGLAGAATRRRPNVLFLLTDDQRADTIGALGNPAIHTPNLDRLARRGMVFRSAYCMGGNNAAVCLPSRNMILSGRAYTRYEKYAPAGEPNFPDSLNQAGYQTYHHGKKANTAVEIQGRFSINKYLNDDQARRSGDPGSRIAGEAVEFLKSRSKAAPFFLYLAFEAPHDPRVPSARHLAMYPPERMPLPRNFLPLHPFDNGEMTVRDELLAEWPRTPENIRRQLAEYYAVITGLDEQIGRVLAALEAAGEAENTIVVFSSDQGLALGSHGLMGKQNLYDHSTKAPLLVAGPGIPRGETAALVYLMDIYPTVLDLVGAPRPAGLDGVSFAPALLGRSRTARESLFLAYRGCQRGIRDERYKLIYYPWINRHQLFDLSRDPDELHDLSQSRRQQSRIGAMRRALEAWQERLNTVAPLDSATPRPARFAPPTGEDLAAARRKWGMAP
ncbi:MAG: sulfatase-like hydrolase/transferase [Acidobacteria bacterium]|nr:sulfatase-like hydrolase/transferase [Acidobacteriota bacterium]